MLRVRRRDHRRHLQAVPRQGDQGDPSPGTRGRRSRRGSTRRAADRAPARHDLPGQVRAAGTGAAGRGGLPRARRACDQAVARAAARRPGGGVRHELREVRGRRRRRVPRLVRARAADRPAAARRRDGRRRARVREPGSSSRSPARSKLRWASCSSSPRRSKPSSSRTSTSHSTTSLRKHAFGTPSSPSAPGGPRCRLTDRLAALVAWFEVAPHLVVALDLAERRDRRARS